MPPTRQQDSSRRANSSGRALPDPDSDSDPDHSSDLQECSQRLQDCDNNNRLDDTPRSTRSSSRPAPRTPVKTESATNPPSSIARVAARSTPFESASAAPKKSSGLSKPPITRESIESKDHAGELQTGEMIEIQSPSPAVEDIPAEDVETNTEQPDSTLTSSTPKLSSQLAQTQNVSSTLQLFDIRKRQRLIAEEPKGPHKRIMITHLVLMNFKSYAGRQEIGPFHRSFSSVVGPNGSGKSNVIDSLLFVFGFRASKMRQGKISSLIHNSAAHPNLAFCSVEVHFQEVIDLVFINSHPPTYLKPEEEKVHRVGIVEKEKASLEEKKDKAIAYIKDENELVFKQSALYQSYILDCKENLEITDAAIKELELELSSELGRYNGNEEEYRALEKSYKQINKEYESLQKETVEVLRQLAKYDRENVQIQEKQKHIVSKQKKLTKNIQSTRHALSEARSWTENHDEEIKKFNISITELETRLVKEEEELVSIQNGLKGKTKPFSDQIEEKQKFLDPWRQNINETQSVIAVAQSELEILENKKVAVDRAKEETIAETSQIQESRKAKLEEIRNCGASFREIEQKIATVRRELDACNNDNAKSRDELQRSRAKADDARASLSASQNQGNVLGGLLRLKESGRINGFHGRLGNLGTIDVKFDVAISTACPQLDSLIVDSVEVGQQCIDYLRKNNLGRASFICLDRLASRDLRPIDTSENVPRLFDLVKIKDTRFAPAFYSVLQNTLVAKDLAQANRIAYGQKRWRVVTLDGQLIDKAGTMSGGGSRIMKGAMSSKLVAETTKEAVAKLEKDVEAQESDFQQNQQRKNDLERNLQELENQNPKIEIQISKLKLEISSFDKSVTDLERRITELGKGGLLSKAELDRMSLLEEQIRAGGKIIAPKALVDCSKHEKTLKSSEEELESIAEELKALDVSIQEKEIVATSIREQAEEAKYIIETKAEKLTTLKGELTQKTDEINALRAAEIEMRNRLEEHQKIVAENNRKLKHWQEKHGKLELHNPSEWIEGEDHIELSVCSVDELHGLDKNELKGEIAVLEERTLSAKVDLAVLEEYKRRADEYQARSKDLEQATFSRDSAKKRCDDLRKRRLNGFMDGFNIISIRLKEMYQMITMGGNAELELVDSLDPFSEGILFSVMPPKKSWKNISNLSGGEKTLSSLALVFALHHFKPTPLYVMDEIDAALDFRNVSIIANYIKERTKNAQFIVISLRNNMFELSARLVGIYKTSNMTKSITIDNKDYMIKSHGM
ncbi:Structural maintenance of chromosomes protein 4 [Neolecta irregularis DAH-3]|uniref:Structural maintenance of chromosomes protein n=1 Tax=Neolecta irregularis (strain DAH-3) TaxID=1198029 RepID=A0A1U7LU75_NEOID|nr:Structural maintenance of chromosomes protein 4 [Neolecta irregularis DAH-3]|eukprot:OLL26168.1 Structural maintenance of chromosomes protein 4 [Neolecta irregularis DAH-3]